MPSTLTRWRTPSDKALQEAVLALDWLASHGFVTGAMRQLLDAHGKVKDRRHLALTLLSAHGLRHAEGEPLEAEAIATLLVLAAGKEQASEAIAHALARPRDEATRAVALELANVLELDLRPPDATDGELKALARELAGIMGDQEACAACAALLGMPTFLRLPLAEALIAKGKPRARLLRVAALAQGFPFDAPIKRRFRDWLAAKGGADGAWLLARLADGPTPAEQPHPAFAHAMPLDWPVIEAFASAPDGSGSQVLLVARRRPNGRVAVFNAVVSDQRGVVSGASQAASSRRAYRQLLELMRLSVGTLVSVPAGDVLTRLEAGVARSCALGLPVPFDVQASRYLLWGLTPARAPRADAHERKWHAEDRLDDTDRILRTELGRSWIFDETAATRPFFERAGKALLAGRTNVVWLSGRPAQGYASEATLALDALVGHWLCTFYDTATRRLWHDRLMETAELAHLAHDAELRTLLATAAWAIAPDSGVPLSEQPFARELLAQSAFAWLEQEEQADELDMIWLTEVLGEPR